VAYGGLVVGSVAQCSSLLKNTHIDDFDPLRILHLRSDFDVQL
jgi:hypothetical protein